MLNNRLFSLAFTVLVFSTSSCIIPTNTDYGRNPTVGLVGDVDPRPKMALSTVNDIMFFETLPPRGGLIYTHKFIPLDVNAYKTQKAETISKGDIKHFHYYIDFRWDSNAIGDLVKRANIENLVNADLEILSVLSIWTQYWVHLYGTTKEKEEESG